MKGNREGRGETLYGGEEWKEIGSDEESKSINSGQKARKQARRKERGMRKEDVGMNNKGMD